MSRWVTVFLTLALAASTAQAQFGGLLDQAVRKGADAAGKAVTQPAKPAPAPAPAPAAKPAPAEPAPAPAAPSPAPAAPAGGGAAAAAPAESGSPEVYANEFDFVPGDRVIFFEDFSDTPVGDYPVKWTRKCSHGGGEAVEVIEQGGRHWLRWAAASGGGWSTDCIRSTFQDLPQKFTLEFDAYIDTPAFRLLTDRGTQLEISTDRANAQTSRASMPVKKGLKHVSISVNGTYVKLYQDGKRLLADPDGIERPIKYLSVSFWYPEKGKPLMFTNFRLAEGGKDYAKELVSLGRIVTHGITFDTGSDVIKPESGPTLRNILKVLNDDPALRFEVQGHTDSQGSAKVNGPLSERRAAAVKAWLVGQGVDAARLTTKGLGDTKPIDTNDTAEGRANNRRVEFVKT
jgi:outer membrane protein OmpA-like peptidoglycan-associated protein